MNKSDVPYYRKTWFSDRHRSLLDLVFNIVSPPKGMLRSSQPEQQTFFPLLFSIYSVDGLTILILLLLLSRGYMPLGCKTEFLQKNPKYWTYSQIAMIYVIYAFIVVPYAENLKIYGSVMPPALGLVITLVVWLMANIIASLGDDWAFKDPVFWFTPLTLWGAIGISLTFLYVFNEYYNYYYRINPESQITIILEYINTFGYATILGLVFYTFVKELHRRVIVGNESLTRFFFKLDIFDCRLDKKTMRRYDNEIKAK